MTIDTVDIDKQINDISDLLDIDITAVKMVTLSGGIQFIGEHIPVNGISAEVMQELIEGEGSDELEFDIELELEELDEKEELFEDNVESHFHTFFYPMKIMEDVFEGSDGNIYANQYFGEYNPLSNQEHVDINIFQMISIPETPNREVLFAYLQALKTKYTTAITGSESIEDVKISIKPSNVVDFIDYKKKQKHPA